MEDFQVEGMLELSECSPSLIAPEDLLKSINGVNVAKHYASELLGITDFDYNANTKPLNTKYFESITPNVFNLLQKNDLCDNVGIKFIAHAYNTSCSHQEVAPAKALCESISQSNKALAQLSITYAKRAK